MSEGRITREVGIGEKGEAPADAEITKLAKPEEDEVGGRYLQYTHVVCPLCWGLNIIIEDTECQKWFQCSVCGDIFKY